MSSRGGRGNEGEEGREFEEKKKTEMEDLKDDSLIRRIYLETKHTFPLTHTHTNTHRRSLPYVSYRLHSFKVSQDSSVFSHGGLCLKM